MNGSHQIWQLKPDNCRQWIAFGRVNSGQRFEVDSKPRWRPRLKMWTSWKYHSRNSRERLNKVLLKINTFITSAKRRLWKLIPRSFEWKIDRGHHQFLSNSSRLDETGPYSLLSRRLFDKFLTLERYESKTFTEVYFPPKRSWNCSFHQLRAAELMEANSRSLSVENRPRPPSAYQNNSRSFNGLKSDQNESLKSDNHVI